MTQSRAVHYIVALELAQPRAIEVGAQGTIEFKAGIYLYVGRARRGLDARLERHRRTEDKTLRWHIDYLRQACDWREARLIHTNSECALADELAALPGATRPVAGFGASDCRCKGHLILVDELNDTLPGTPWRDGSS
jgi:Uri superfamily endonuclease